MRKVTKISQKKFDYINDFFSDNSFHFSFKLISLFFILLPLTLVTGPFLPDLFLSIIAIYFFIISIKKKLFNYYKNIFVYIFVLFYLVMLSSGIFSNNFYASLISYNGPIFYFRYLFFVLGALYILNQNKNIIKYFLLTLLLVILFTILDGLILLIFKYSIFGGKVDINHGNRLTGIFKDEQILGHFLSYVVPLCFALIMFVFKPRSKGILIVFSFLILCELFIFITNDRTAFLKIIQFTILLIFLSNRFKLLRLISFGISILLISFILSSSSSSQHRYIETTIKDVSSTKIPYMPWSPLHEKHFSLAFNFFKDSPIIGNGPQYFKYTCIENPNIIGCSSHPHNYYFQILAELGVVGFMFLFLIFLYLTLILLRQFFNVWFLKNKATVLQDYMVPMYSLVFLFVWPLSPNFSFYNNWVNVLIYIAISFLFYFQNFKKLSL